MVCISCPCFLFASSILSLLLALMSILLFNFVRYNLFSSVASFFICVLDHYLFVGYVFILVNMLILFVSFYAFLLCRSRFLLTLHLISIIQDILCEVLISHYCYNGLQHHYFPLLHTPCIFFEPDL